MEVVEADVHAGGGDDLDDIQIVCSETVQHQVYSQSYSSVVAKSKIAANSGKEGANAGNEENEENAGNLPVFKTPEPDGAFRDELVVEIMTLNDRPFYGTVTNTEARSVIFEKSLGFEPDALASITIGFNRGRIITYKLKQQINIDLLHGHEFFNFMRKSTNRSGEPIEAKIGCKIRGTRKPNARPRSVERRPSSAAQYVDDGTRKVYIEGCEYRLTETEVLNWCNLFGTVTSEIREEAFEEDEESDRPPIGNGTYSVLIKLQTDLPQLVPMYGKRVRLYHRGITKLCSNCFGPHARRVCKNEKVNWLSYVKQFMNNFPETPTDYYGKWAELAKNWNEPLEHGKQQNNEPNKTARPPLATSSTTPREPTPANIAENQPQIELQGVGLPIKKSNEEMSEDWNEVINRLVSQGFTPHSMEKTALAQKKKEQTAAARGRGRGRGKGQTQTQSQPGEQPKANQTD